MATTELHVQRFSVTSSRTFSNILAAVQKAVGHPEMAEFMKNVNAARNSEELETIIHQAVGPSGFMEFVRFDLGEILRKRYGAQAPRNVRLVIGNPLIMSLMAQHVPDAGSYAPVTILIDERADGVHLSYDRMASYLASYGSSEALKVARELDAKIEALLRAAAIGDSKLKTDAA
jgi:uncharacterized protein (DUF302 family)